MKLSEKSIEQEAIKLYQKSLDKNYISDDFSSEIYYRFIKRMKAYSKKHPEKTEVSDHFTNKVLKNLIRDLNRRESRNNYNEEDIESCHCFYEEDIPGYHEEKGSEEMEALLDFIKLAISRRANYIEYARCFLLYYVYYLPLGYIQRAYQLLGLDETGLDFLVKELREKAINFKSQRIDHREKLLHFYYHRIINCHRKIATTESKLEKEYYQKQETLYKDRQASVINESPIEEILPRHGDLARLINSTCQNVSYGLRVFIEDFKQYLQLPEGVYFQFVKKAG